MKAFPYSSDESKQYNWINHGMDLRDYFAAKAMQAMMAHPDSNESAPARLYAEGAYVMADAMMEARLK
jgi:hypothetical protein